MHNARNLFNLHSSQLFMPPAECIPGVPPRIGSGPTVTRVILCQKGYTELRQSAIVDNEMEVEKFIFVVI